MFNFFKSNNNKQQNNNVGEIILSITENSKINIEIVYDPNNSNAAQNIGEALYLLNKGLLMKYFVEKLNSNLNTKDHKAFSQNVLSAWDKMYFLENVNEPIIKPLNTFYKNAK